MSTPTLAFRAAAALRSASVTEHPALVGFDGFIDNICEVVDRRQSATSYSKVRTLAAYGERIAAAAGKSTNVEIVPVLVKLGGNGPIMANALTAFEVPLTYCGMTGYPNTNAVFAEFASRATLLPISEPALTDAYEFDDGKLIVGKHATVAEVSYDNLVERVGLEAWRAAWKAAKFVGMVNWTMLPYMTELWQKMLEEESEERKTVFFDLADPEKRTSADIKAALETIAAFQAKHDVILGLNEKESLQVGHELDVEIPIGGVLTEETAQELADAIRARLNVGVVVIHPTRFAAAANFLGTAAVVGPWTPTPKISTGAGDHFNAGFCLGQIVGAPLDESLQIGVGTSGYYVRNAASPEREQLAEFLESL